MAFGCGAERDFIPAVRAFRWGDGCLLAASLSCECKTDFFCLRALGLFLDLISSSSIQSAAKTPHAIVPASHKLSREVTSTACICELEDWPEGQEDTRLAARTRGVLHCSLEPQMRKSLILAVCHLLPRALFRLAPRHIIFAFVPIPSPRRRIPVLHRTRQ